MVEKAIGADAEARRSGFGSTEVLEHEQARLGPGDARRGRVSTEARRGKAHRVHACCVDAQAFGHELQLAPDMAKKTTEAARVVFHGCCACSASVLRVRARTKRVEHVRECAGAAR